METNEEKGEKKYVLQTNWGKRNSTNFLVKISCYFYRNKIEELHEKKVKPWFYGIATPRTSVLEYFRFDGTEREMLRQAQEQEKEMEERVKKEKEANKKIEEEKRK